MRAMKHMTINGVCAQNSCHTDYSGLCHSISLVFIRDEDLQSEPKLQYPTFPSPSDDGVGKRAAR